LAGFKLMTTIAEHFDLVNKSTYHQNLNRGLVLDKSRYSMQQKQQDQFSKNKKLGQEKMQPDTNTRDIGNFTADQLQQVGYRYGYT
jgi:hypothetical protein